MTRRMGGVVQRIATGSLAVARHAPILAPLGMAVFGVVAMLCLLAGQLRTWLVWPLGSVAAIWAMARVYRRTKRVARPGSVRERNWVDVIVLAMVVLWAATNLPFTYQHVFTDRDPATYNLAAGWLIHHHSLQIPVSGPGALVNLPGIDGSSLGFFPAAHDPHLLNAQGAHLLPALLGIAGRVVGFGTMLHLNVLIGALALLAMYGFGRLIMRPRWAALATLAVALSLPFIYFSRDTYSEPLTMAFLFTGLSLIYYAEKLARRSLWFMAGVVAGAASLARVDTFLSLAAIELFALTRLLYARAGEHRWLLRRVLLMALGAAIAGVVAWQDLARLSTLYYQSLHPEISRELELLAVLAAAIVIGLALTRFADLLALSQRLTATWLSRTLWVAIPLLFLVLASRPLWFVGYQPLASGGARSFSEQTINWIWWYIGPLMFVAGAAGFAWLWTGLVRLKRTPYLPFVLVVTVVAIVYLIRPSITGDQPWASRRFLPVVIPGFCLMGMLVFEYFYDRKRINFHGFRLRLQTPVTVLATLAVVTPLVLSYPFWIRRMFVPELAQVQAVCTYADHGQVVLWLGEARHFAVQPTHTICGNDSLGVADALTATPAATADSLRLVAQKSGRPIVVGMYAEQLDLLPPAMRQHMQLISSISYANIEHSYLRAPRNAYLTAQTIYMAPLTSLVGAPKAIPQ